MKYLDIPKIYNDPVISRRRLGTEIQPFLPIKETVTIDKFRAILTEIPNRYEKVKVTGRGKQWHESKDGVLEENMFRVDYTNGIVYFHESVNNVSLVFEYLGEGVFLFPDSRVYHTGEGSFPTVKDKFEDVDRAILVQKSRVDELIIKNPQPSEVVDMRVDYNGKIFKVAKDRIDAEQQKIEEAYFDAKGVKYGSLKERIDSLQLSTEEELDDTGNEIVKIWAEISLVPGQIKLEVGRLEDDMGEYIHLLQSQIDMIPEKISLSVKDLKEYVDGELDYSKSQIDILSNEIDLKVDVNGVVSSINLSEEGVRISGKKLWLDGETRIDNAVIKSAHIDSLSADKISAGVIDADKIGVRGGSATEYLNLVGNTFELRGQYTTTWFGQTKHKDVKFQFQDGYLRVRNDAEDKSLYFTDYGIHSFLRGYDDESPNAEYMGSGVIEFFSHEWDGTGVRGMRIFSNRGSIGLQTNTRDIILDAARSVKISGKNSVEISGTNTRVQALGVPEPYTNMYLGVSGERDGELRITNKLFYNKGNPRYLDVRARYYRGRAFIDNSKGTFLYFGSDLGVRVASRGINGNNPIIYRPIQASAFQVRSSRESKENIKRFNGKGLDIINDLNVVNFNYKGDKERKVGFIAEDSPSITSNENKFVDLNSLTTYLTKAVQELSSELKQVKKELKEVKGVN